MDKKKLEKVILKSDYSRRYPDPLNSTQVEETYSIEHHVLLCKAKDVPSGISKEPNPREQRIDLGIYKDIQTSLEDGEEPTFHLKNKGITLLAHSIDYSEDKKVATVYLGEKDGIADGGHTYEIILNAISRGACPDSQYVKFEILTGVPSSMAVDITGGLNTAVQVQEASLANLEGAFDWIREIIKREPYADKIAFKQNERKDVDIRDIVAFLTLFNVEQKSLKGRHPREAYTSKAACLNLYKDDQDSYEMLAPILKDILYLSDYVHIKSREIYNAETGGKAGGMKGVYEGRLRGKFHFVFMDTDYEYKLYSGTLFPILGALRYLVEKKPGQNVYSWKLRSFEEVKSFFNKIAADMVGITYNTSINYGRKPNAVGKDENHWDNLYKTVALAYLQGRR
ncbi:MAG: AIPR family protein [Candidatus Omnitrophota bacterium]